MCSSLTKRHSSLHEHWTVGAKVLKWEDTASRVGYKPMRNPIIMTFTCYPCSRMLNWRTHGQTDRRTAAGRGDAGCFRQRDASADDRLPRVCYKNPRRTGPDRMGSVNCCDSVCEFGNPRWQICSSCRALASLPNVIDLVLLRLQNFDRLTTAPCWWDQRKKYRLDDIEISAVITQFQVIHTYIHTYIHT